jgi:hypothetical protein
MSNVPTNIEETKERGHREDDQTFDSQQDQELTIERLTHNLNNLFEPSNLQNNAYLVSKAAGASFHIPVKFIYDENSIKALTYDKNLIDQAIERAENVTPIKKSDIIEYVKPTTDQLRKTIIVKGITKDSENDFRELVDKFEGAQEGIINWLYNPQLNVINIVCRDEKVGSELYNYLSSQTFRDSVIDCALNFESLYISALELLKKRPKRPIDHQKNRGGYMMPQYQMPPYYFNPMNNGYMRNFYPPPNFFMPGQMNPMAMPMNPNINGPNIRGGPQQMHYKNSGKRGGFNKRQPGKRGGRYNKNGGYKQNQPTNVEVNDSDFPPLSNENQEGSSPGK